MLATLQRPSLHDDVVSAQLIQRQCLTDLLYPSQVIGSMQIQQLGKWCARRLGPIQLVQRLGKVAQTGLAQALSGWVNGNQFWLGRSGRCVENLIFRVRHGQMPANKGDAAIGANMFAFCKRALLGFVEVKKSQSQLSLTIADEHLKATTAAKSDFAAENFAFDKGIVACP